MQGDRTHAHFSALGADRVGLFQWDGDIDSGRWQRRRRLRIGRESAGEQRAMSRHTEDRLRSRLGRAAGHLPDHCAAVHAVAPAARRQAQLAPRLESGRQRSQPEQQYQRDGKHAPHLAFMLHDGCASQEPMNAPVRYHRLIRHFLPSNEETHCPRRIHPLHPHRRIHHQRGACTSPACAVRCASPSSALAR